MGSVKLILGDFEGAMSDFSAAIRQDPNYYLAYNNRGYANYQMGNLDSALNDFSLAIELYPEFMEAQLNIASVFTQWNELEKAIETLSATIADYPETGLLYLNRGLIKEMKGDVVGACSDWTKASELGEELATEYVKECR